MPTFAVLNGSIVTNIIVADSLQDAKELTNSDCVEYTEETPAYLGWSFDGEKFVNLKVNE
jgi:hypothetical protein